MGPVAAVVASATKYSDALRVWKLLLREGGGRAGRVPHQLEGRDTKALEVARSQSRISAALRNLHRFPIIVNQEAINWITNKRRMSRIGSSFFSAAEVQAT